MKKLWNGLRIFLEVVGACALLWLGFTTFMREAFKGFAGGNCTDTEQRIVASPDGKHTLKSFHRVCGGIEDHGWTFVYLSTGNPNAGYEYTPIVTIEDVAPGQTSAEWDGSDKIRVSYPATAGVGDAYAKVLGVRVVLDPALP